MVIYDTCGSIPDHNLDQRWTQVTLSRATQPDQTRLNSIDIVSVAQCIDKRTHTLTEHCRQFQPQHLQTGGYFR